MPKLEKSLRCWGKAVFSQTLKNEIASTRCLPLDKMVTPGTFADGDNVETTIFHIVDNQINIHAKVGVFFSEVMPSYCCGEEEPMISNAYREVMVILNKFTAEAKFIVIQD